MLDNDFFKEPMPVPAQTSPLDLPVTIEPVLSFHSDDPLIKGALMLFIRDFERYHGVKIKISDGSYDNIKLTTPEDMIIGERILRKRGITE